MWSIWLRLLVFLLVRNQDESPYGAIMCREPNGFMRWQELSETGNIRVELQQLW